MHDYFEYFVDEPLVDGHPYLSLLLLQEFLLLIIPQLLELLELMIKVVHLQAEVFLRRLVLLVKVIDKLLLLLDDI